jgi:hypothetical protein
LMACGLPGAAVRRGSRRVCSARNSVCPSSPIGDRREARRTAGGSNRDRDGSARAVGDDWGPRRPGGAACDRHFPGEQHRVSVDAAVRTAVAGSGVGGRGRRRGRPHSGCSPTVSGCWTRRPSWPPGPGCSTPGRAARPTPPTRTRWSPADVDAKTGPGGHRGATITSSAADPTPHVGSDVVYRQLVADQQEPIRPRQEPHGAAMPELSTRSAPPDQRHRHRPAPAPNPPARNRRLTRPPHRREP